MQKSRRTKWLHVYLAFWTLCIFNVVQITYGGRFMQIKSKRESLTIDEVVKTKERKDTIK